MSSDSSSPSIDQIISQATIMNSTTPIDLNTLFEGFDDTSSIHHYIQQPYGSANAKAGKSADNIVQSLFLDASTSSSLQQNSYQASPMMNTPCLEAFTPALTGFMGDSPALVTPFMDPMGGSSFMGASGMDLDCIENYFTPQMATAPDANLSSVDPSDLCLGQMQPNQQANVQADDDSLFPPLTHEELQCNAPPSSGNDLDLLFDDLFGTSEVFPSNDTGFVEPIDMKRKRSDDDKVDNDQQPMKQPKLDDTQQFVCNICQRGFSRRYNLGTHIKTHNKNRTKPFGCHLCTKSFDRKHDCERHVSTVHLGERLYTCKPCKVSFSRRDALSRHHAQKHAN